MSRATSGTKAGSAGNYVISDIPGPMYVLNGFVLILKDKEVNSPKAFKVNFKVRLRKVGRDVVCSTYLRYST